MKKMSEIVLNGISRLYFLFKRAKQETPQSSLAAYFGEEK
jgi:hypothetical protein